MITATTKSYCYMKLLQIKTKINDQAHMTEINLPVIQEAFFPKDS